MNTQTRTILIIDDEETMHDSCMQILKREGYTLLDAYNGENGMSYVRESRPDLVLLDLKMPGKSGHDILNEIKTIDPTIVTVVITGYATVESAVEAMKLGASDFLPKPFTPDELRMIVRRGLEKRHLLIETRRLQAENERIKENFVSIITHEMRSPLVAVDQYHQIFLGGFAGELLPKQIEILTQCRQRIKWLLSLVNEWLSIARLRDTTVFEKFEDITLRSVLDEAMKLVDIQAEKKSVTVEFYIPEDIGAIEGNRDALIHLFMNLYSNAIKYNIEGGQVVTRVADERDSVSIKVSDTGIGIPQESLPFVFEEFFRVPLSEEGAKKGIAESGTGLGLSIVRKIVEAHRGYISVESQVNVGTCFTVMLPKKQQDTKKNNIPA